MGQERWVIHRPRFSCARRSPALGRGSGHPVNLNFGDCFSYALARDMRESML
jgi:uncharacterized protein with PIN domain